MAAMSGSDEHDNVVRLPRHRSHGILRQWPITLVLAGVALAMILIALDSFRRGSVVLSASVLLAAFLRLLLPEGDAGLLAVRSKKIDVITLGLLGLGVTVFTFWVPPPS
ncbi:MAG: DUF3017 domain-containing protein [Candidatus Nanopelagicales bacterium]|jgi:hypothetical protein|nr:DUF3017 domain-containing protein [Candidatus Nanopelagicales bacterium]MCF8538352.1 DUF3017 domain-containing protein [Candidatus Nanopelagicales bacterium]